MGVGVCVCVCVGGGGGGGGRGRLFLEKINSYFSVFKMCLKKSLPTSFITFSGVINNKFTPEPEK